MPLLDFRSLTIGLIIGIVVCIIMGHFLKKNIIGRAFKKLDHVIMFVSALIFTLGIIFDNISQVREMSVTYLNIFASIIFSWLMTKWSAKKEYEEQEINLSKISYRHIQQTEASVITLIKEIREFLKQNTENPKSDTINVDPKEELRSVLSTLEHLKGSIGANKQDWLDKLPENYLKESIPRVDIGSMKVLETLSDETINQETA